MLLSRVEYHTEMKVIFLLVVATVTSCAPLYGDNGGYAGYASYRPPNRGNQLRSEDKIDRSAQKPVIPRNTVRNFGDTYREVPQTVPKKYVPPKYVPPQNHGYSNKKTSSSALGPYGRATLYGQREAGGYKISDTLAKNARVANYEDNSLDYKDDKVKVHIPQPYEYGYSIKDKHGNAQHKHETKDAEGTVKGSYGFMDEHGLYRTVEYIADKNGFRAFVKTNEPGTKNSNPADVEIQSEENNYYAE